MVVYKEWVASLLKGKRVRFMCDCLVKMDVTGVVVDASAQGNEIIYTVESNGRYIKIGENTPKLRIDIL